MRVTQDTDRIDLFVRKHIGEPTDDARQEFIRWNIRYFAERKTYWLEEGVNLLLEAPLAPAYHRLQIGSDSLLELGTGGHLIVG